MSNPLNRLGGVVADALIHAGLAHEDADGLNVSEASRRTHIARETLRRKINNGNFTAAELVVIAEVAGVTPSDLLHRFERAA